MAPHINQGSPSAGQRVKLIAQMRYQYSQGNKAPTRHLDEFVSRDDTIAFEKGTSELLRRMATEYDTKANKANAEDAQRR
jgi:hypothetical protein